MSRLQTQIRAALTYDVDVFAGVDIGLADFEEDQTFADALDFRGEERSKMLINGRGWTD